jgi:hypothetical protein
VKVQVNPAKQVAAVVTDPADTDEFAETVGEISVKFTLTEAYEDSTIYAFLVPLDEASSNLVVSKAFTQGISIKSGDTESTGVARLELLDGTDLSQPLTYSIVLRTARTWNSGETIGTYESKDLELFVNNVKPSVLAVNMTGSAPVTVSGGTFAGKASMGLNKIFTLEADDIEADLTNAVTSVWTFSDPNGYAVTKTITAPLEDISLTNVFEVAGTYTCTVKLQDKDMSKRDFGPVFEFNVVVLDAPSIQIEFPNSSTFHETEADKGQSYFYVELSTPATKPIEVELECVRIAVPSDEVFTGCENESSTSECLTYKAESIRTFSELTVVVLVSSSLFSHVLHSINSPLAFFPKVIRSLFDVFVFKKLVVVEEDSAGFVVAERNSGEEHEHLIVVHKIILSALVPPRIFKIEIEVTDVVEVV